MHRMKNKMEVADSSREHQHARFGPPRHGSGYSSFQIGAPFSFSDRGQYVMLLKKCETFLSLNPLKNLNCDTVSGSLKANYKFKYSTLYNIYNTRNVVYLQT
jgi:hypothetical protein